MAKSFLLEPEAVGERLRARFNRQRSAWLRGEGNWPLRLVLGVPSEAEALAHGAQVAHWVQAWRRWDGPGRVEWIERHWSRVGTQQVPVAVEFEHPGAVAATLALEREWHRASERLAEVCRRWPALAPVAASAWEVLANWADDGFERLLALVDWLHRHPHSGLLIRQLPVPGVDSKWLERHRRTVTAWLAVLQGETGQGDDLHALAGLRRLPVRLRMRVLCPALRAALGGLGDIEAPVEEIAALGLPVATVFIVENLQTGLAFGDLQGALVFMQQGYAVDVFGQIPWLRDRPVFYWGDIDTNGLAILDRLRAGLPQARSLLMDEQTLLRHRALWSHEARPAQASGLSRLTGEESALYRDLRGGRWGSGVRLEQERIEWDAAWKEICSAVSLHQELRHQGKERRSE